MNEQFSEVRDLRTSDTITMSNECIARGNAALKRLRDLDRKFEALTRRSDKIFALSNTVARCARHITRLRALIEDWQRQGYDTKLAKALLTTLNENLLLHQEHYASTVRKLREADKRK